VDEYKCIVCGGKGKVEKTSMELDRYYIQCPECDGLGKNPPYSEELREALRKFKGEHGFLGPGKDKLRSFLAGWKARDKQESK